MSQPSSTTPGEPAGPVKPVSSVNPALPVEAGEPPDAAVPAPASTKTSRVVTAVAVLIVLLFTPAWVDPATLVELSGGTPSPPAGLGLPLPDPRTGFVPLSVAAPPAAGPAKSVATAPVDAVTLVDPGDTQAVVVSGSPARDVDFSFSVAIDKLPVGGTLYIFPLIRSTGDSQAYRPRLFVTQDGAVYVHAGLIDGGKEQSLGREVLVANMPDIASHVLRFRAYIAGSDPTTILAKVWDAATPEPPQWEFGATDWTGVLQKPGALGVAAYLGRNVTNAPITVRISDLTVTATDPTN